MADPEQSAQGTELEPIPCMPCRGTGAVVSYLGGETNSVPCPWCEGTGVRHAGVDAQARWLATPVESPG